MEILAEQAEWKLYHVTKIGNITVIGAHTYIKPWLSPSDYSRGHCWDIEESALACILPLISIYQLLQTLPAEIVRTQSPGSRCALSLSLSSLEHITQITPSFKPQIEKLYITTAIFQGYYNNEIYLWPWFRILQLPIHCWVHSRKIRILKYLRGLSRSRHEVPLRFLQHTSPTLQISR